MIRGERFTVDLSDEETAVVMDEGDDLVQLLIQKRPVRGDDGDPDDAELFAVMGADFRDRGIKPALEAADEAFDDAAFLFQRADRVQMHIDGKQTCEHDFDFHLNNG